MPQRTRRNALVATVIAVAIVAFAITATTLSASSPPERAEVPLIHDWGANAPTVTTGDAFAGARYVADVHAATVWLFGVHQAEVARQEAAAEAAAAAARSRPSSGGGGSRFVGTAVGACTGFVIPDYIIQRESGGDPNAHNPSGAHGCTQTLMSHYTGGQCQGMDPNTVQGQRDCTYVLSDGGTNLDPWKATR